MYDYTTQLDGEAVVLRRLTDCKEICLQGDEATIVLNDIDTIGLEATCLMQFERV